MDTGPTTTRAGGAADTGRFEFERTRRPGGYDEVVRHMRRGEAMRAEAMAEFLGSLHRGAKAALARRRRRRATYHALMHCSDRVLADLGVAREDIRPTAAGSDPRRKPGDNVLRRGWHGLRTRLEATRRRRRVYRELTAYRDGELADIGIRRADIPAIARSEYMARVAAG